MQMLPESGDDRSPSRESGEHVSPDPAKIAGFQRRHYSSDLMMPDSGAAYFQTTDYCRIRPVKYQTYV
jgi:hypothetical protein